MTENNIREVKLNKMIKASIKATGLIMPKYLESKKALNKANGLVDKEGFIIVAHMIAVYSHNIDDKQKALYMKNILLTGMSESEFKEKRKVANSPVIKSIIKSNSSHQSTIQQLEKLELNTMTSVKTFKKEHKIIEGELKAKKDLPVNTVQSEKPIEEKPLEKVAISKMTREQLLNEIATRELEIDLMKVQLEKLNQEGIGYKIA